uniref:CASP-like protein n=1 Tax=Kalanchoe fedtschenkoi TaxID=63787 RepID=A0A7N1A761_KALFE
MAPPQPRPAAAVVPPPSADQYVYSPPSSSAELVVKLVCKALTALLTFISLIILLTNNVSEPVLFRCTGVVQRVKFYDVSAYRQHSPFSTSITSQKRLHTRLAVVDFYGDQQLAAAGFGATVDLQRVLTGDIFNEYYGKGYATSSMLFFASISTAVSLTLSK